MCTLPYPDRFYAAVAFAANPPTTARGVTDETRLLLYALFQQVMPGYLSAQRLLRKCWGARTWMTFMHPACDCAVASWLRSTSVNPSVDRRRAGNRAGRGWVAR